MASGFWSRIRESRHVRVLLVYLGASWGVLEATDFFSQKFGLPSWFFTIALALLVVGLVGLVIAGWLDARPAPQKRDASGPNPWEVDLVDIKDSVSAGRLPRFTLGRWALGGLVAFSLLFGSAGLYVLVTQRGISTQVPGDVAVVSGPAVAVLPFRVVGPEAELWREGMVDLLYNNLDGVAGLRVISPSTVLSRWHAVIGEDGTPAESRVLDMARGMGATHALLGNMVGSARALRISVDVHNLETGDHQRAQVEGSPDSVLVLVDRLCMEILSKGLAGASDDLPQLDVARITTSSLPALVAYLAGEQKYRRSRFRESVDDFERALEADSTFALAMSRISKAYGWIDPFSPVTGEWAHRAAEYADRLPERESLFLRSDLALEDLRVRAVDLGHELTARYPDDAAAWHQLGEAYYHVSEQALLPRQRFRDAFVRAVELDPNRGPSYIHLIDDALIRSETTRAIELIERHRSIDPTSPHARGLRLVQDLAFGDSIAQARAMAAMDTAGSDVLFTAFARFAWSTVNYWPLFEAVSRKLLQPRHPPGARANAFAGLAMVAAHRGQYREARAVIDAAEESLGIPFTQGEISFHLTAYPDLVRADRMAQLTDQLADSGAIDRFWLGALAAHEHRWDEVERQAELLESAEEETPQASSFDVGNRVAMAQALRGYAAWRREDYDTAKRLLEEILTDVPVDVNGFLRFELGKLHLTLSDAETAERYFASLAISNQTRVVVYAQTEYYLGETYEALGQPDEAARHYARFVEWWEEADPELQPWIDRARQALERLSREAA